MPVLTINGVNVEVPEGATLLDAAQRAGAAIPTLCYLKEIGPLASCMVCVVKDTVSGRMLPACSAKAVDGMQIETNSDDVRAARREILQMLLSEHVGDCEGPCSHICPAHLSIPRMLRYIASGDPESAARLAKRDLIFPATLGRICTAPCEKGCRRGEYDSHIDIRRLHAEMGEYFIENVPAACKTAPPSAKTVAIVGTGLAGLSAAWVCLTNGYACHVYERRATICSSLRSFPEEQLPRRILDAEIDSVRSLGAEFVLNSEVGAEISVESLRSKFDAVIVACDLSVTPGDGLFVAKTDSMPVRAVAAGKIAAQHAAAFLSGSRAQAIPHAFNAQIGRLRPEETSAYAVERLSPAANASTPSTEAARCLHCDCLKPVSCKLRQYAQEYGVGPRIDRHMKRLPVAPIQRFEEVLFEPGKCIKCGICVEISRAEGDDLGMTFTGRGLQTRVQAPFEESLARGLGKAALRCVQECPTGALAFRNQEETHEDLPPCSR